MFLVPRSKESALPTSINDFVRKYNMKNKATSNIKKIQILSSSSLSDVGIYLRYGPFTIDVGTVDSHPTNGTHWVEYNNEYYFDSYGCSLPNKISIYIVN